mmetsp:Transcript_27215/g.43670  ORF Transcript_27215/g.43670 Transcript_27215/m.43670 type:complete len:236 (+) Transcript_27215:282-989(+)
MHATLPASSSTDKTSTAMPDSFKTRCARVCNDFGSTSSSFNTACRRPAAAAAFASPTAEFTMPSRSAFFSCFATFDNLLSQALRSSRNFGLRCAEIVASLIANLRFFNCSRTLSIAAMSSAEAAASCAVASDVLKSSPVSLAFVAASPVMPTTRRTPFATAVSSTSANSDNTSVFETWVPPQNSIEYSFHFSLLGSANSSSTVGPIETTRTGSGYLSPKTARKLLISFALSRGTT